MVFRIDLKIFLLILLFYFTNQIETYFLMLVFTVLHELGHIVVGLIFGLKLSKMEINIYGFTIEFLISNNDYNKKILKGNRLELKKIFIAFAGPLTNILIIIISFIINDDILKQINIIYANLILLIFNLIPIYPLDGGRIFKGTLHILFGKQVSEKIVNYTNILVLLALTLILGYSYYITTNIAIILIIIFLWAVSYIEIKKYNKKRKLYGLIEKSIEKKKDK